MLTTTPALFAHAGGWDEFLVFAGPILLVYIVLRWWDRRRGPAEPDSDPSAHSEAADEGSGVVDDLEGTR